MKRLIFGLIIIFLMLGSYACADHSVKTTGVGNETNTLHYTVMDSGIEYWFDSISSKYAFAFIRVRNDETKNYIYLNSCNFDFEDDNGHIVESTNFVNTAPNVIAPGESGFFYVTNYLINDNVDFSNGLNLIAQFSLKKSIRQIDSFPSSDKSVTWNDRFSNELKPTISGRITNNTDTDENSVQVVCILADARKKVIGIDSTYINNLFAGSTVGFSIDMYNTPPEVTKTNYKYFRIIAKPYYYQ